LVKTKKVFSTKLMSLLTNFRKAKLFFPSYSSGLPFLDTASMYWTKALHMKSSPGLRASKKPMWPPRAVTKIATCSDLSAASMGIAKHENCGLFSKAVNVNLTVEWLEWVIGSTKTQCRHSDSVQLGVESSSLVIVFNVGVAKLFAGESRIKLADSRTLKIKYFKRRVQNKIQA